MVSPLQRIVRSLVIVSPFFYPAYLLRFKVAGVPFTGLEGFTYLLFGLWLFEVVRDRRNIVWDKLTRRFWFAVFLLVVGATIGAALAPVGFLLPDGHVLDARQVALGIWKGWVIAPILYFAVLTQVLRTTEEVRKTLRSFVYSAALVGLVSHVLALFSSGLTFDFRLKGFFDSANYLALYVGPAILLAIYFLFGRGSPKKIWEYLDIASLSILIYTILFTQSYAGILAVFGALGLFVLRQLIRTPRQRKAIGLALTVLVLAFLAIMATQIRTPKFQQFMDFENRSSTSVRLEIYRVALDLVEKHPLVGVGPGLFQANYQADAPLVLGHAPMEWNMPHPHNIFLGFWLNAGILGLAAFLTLLVLAHRRFTYPLIALWSIVIHGLFDMPFWKNDLAMIFWLIIAAIVILQKEHKTK
jgi:O-antigen ligase